jgi:hypothetical protein
VAYPEEQIGYLASEEYVSRMSSPNPPTPGVSGGRHRTNSQPTVESPLKRTSFPNDVMESSTGKLEKSTDTVKPHDHALESEDEGYIHVDDPSRRINKVGTGRPYDASTEDLGVTAEEGGWVDERGYGVPILASDEVAKDSEFMQPAVSPYQERRGSGVFFAPDGEGLGDKSGSRTPSISGSRPTSRPASIHGVGTNLARFVSRNEEREDMHTPLEDVEEYEPLFPEEDESKPLTAPDRFKVRPGALKRRFPSQDIWEDSPDSHQHYATVSTPDLPSTATKTGLSETESARKADGEAEKAKKQESLVKSIFTSHVKDEMPARPQLKQRFPSRDIWEDSPDSHYLVTTVSTPEVEEIKSPLDVAPKPVIPPRPAKSKLNESATEPSGSAQPSIPARPPKRLHQAPPANTNIKTTEIDKPAEKQVSPTEGRKAPVIPDRPKPQVPARPSKPKPQDSPEELTKTLSAGSTGSVEAAKDVTSPPLPKAKPMVPARPPGSKIAALQAGFMTDLNKRLQLGPKPIEKEKEPEPEVEVEKAPLTDARKGRARGPTRRKPAVETSPEKSVPSIPKITISAPKMVWSIDEDGDIITEVAKSEVEDVKTPQPSEVPSIEPPLATSTAGESVDPLASSQIDGPTESLKAEGTATAASSTSNLVKTADQTPQEEIDDPLAKIPAATDTTTTAEASEPAAVPESKPAVNLEEARAELERKPTLPDTSPVTTSLSRETSLTGAHTGLGATLAGQKVDASRASDALETLDTGHVGEGGEKSEDEIAKIRHRGSVTIAETGSLARKSTGDEGEE